MADELSLLWKIKADASQVKTATAESRAAVAQLRQSFGPELAQAAKIGQKALEDVSSRAEQFIRQQVPLGNVFVSFTQGLKEMAATAGQIGPATQAAGLSLAEIGSITQRTEAQVAGFIANLGLLGTQAERNAATVGFLGAALASNLRPQLDSAAKAGAELNKILEGSGKSIDEALKFVQALGLIGDSAQRNAAAVSFFGKATAEKLIPQLEKFGSSIAQIAAASGKSGPEVTKFIAQFARLGTDAEKHAAAVRFFGQALATKLGPELEKASTGLGDVALKANVVRTALGSAVAPIGIFAIALGAVALAAGAVVKELFEITKSAADFQGKMFDLAQQTGVAVETLSALEIVAKTTGGEIGNITQSLVTFQRKLDDAQDPLSKSGQLFRDLNIDVSDTETALRQSLTALAGMQEGFAQTNAAAELFGARGGKQMLAILKETNGDLDEAIKRFRELGILISEEDAKAADKLNDELAILHFQFRAVTGAIAKELLPAVTDIVRSVGDLVTAARPLIGIFGSIAGPTSRSLASAFRGLRIVIGLVTNDYIALGKAAKEANEQLKPPPIPPQTTEGPKPVPLTSTPGADLVTQTEAVVAAAKRAAETTNQTVSELFEQGRRNRAQQAEEVIKANKLVLDAERQSLEARIKLKDEEVKAIRERADLSASERDKAIQDAFNEASKLQQDILNKENEFGVQTRAIRLKVATENANARRNQIQSDTDNLLTEIDRQIKNVQAAIERGAKSEFDGLTIIEALEKKKIEIRRKTLEDQRAVGVLTIQAQEELNDQLKKLNQEAAQLQDEQRERRIQSAINESQRLGEIAQALIDDQLAKAETALRIGQITDESRIVAIRALAALRVRTEEQAEREILQIRLAAVDREIELARIQEEAINARNQAEINAIRARRRELDAELQKETDLGRRTAITQELTGLTDAQIAAEQKAGDDREKAEKERNNKTRILNAERKAIQGQGNRDIAAGRQADLDNAREYAEDLNDIQQRIVDIQRDAAEEALRLMVLHFASRQDIIRERLRLDIEDENARHRNALQGIAALKQENAESKRTKEEKLAVDKEINALTEAEAERHRLALEAIQRKGRLKEKEASPLGRLDLDIDNLKEFAAVLEESIVPLGEILTGTFQQVADAIGQTVANWVLLGETGPAVMRKILAQALASIAAEAAVNAIKELALGFATLFFNPAESAGHFTAAALWGAIGGVAAVAGRGVAGNLFKPKTGSQSGGSSNPQELNPLTLGRNQPQPQRIIVEIRTNDSEFGRAISAHVVKDITQAGPIRDTLANDGAF